MLQIIADTYEIEHEIGSGGGGIVYLARHIRLDKSVVLKGDKRSLTAKSETLRREVDALKSLSHTYIPQVYDYVEHDGIVYTVMDFIAGESWDKPLKRGERFPQAQVIEWACQLLEALKYLHGRPPHGILHADIKPANVMLTPEGTIRLIDYNIALALGEEGAVGVGRSFGYASPEHYGADYSAGSRTQSVTTDYITTQLVSQTDVKTRLELDPGEPSSDTSGKKVIMLDVRSDIYSLGATLYHILTGQRPAREASEVVPISGTEYSPAVIAIIAKAMNPNPDLRYQSAGEMLYDLEHLHDNDSRTKRFKRTRLISFMAAAALFLAGGVSAFIGLKQMEQTQAAYALAQYSAEALAAGDHAKAVSLALQALPEPRSVLAAPYTVQAQKALADALGVYELSDGFKAYRTVDVSSEVMKAAISPDGTTLAVICAWELALIDTESGEAIATLPIVESALADVEFVNNELVAYAGKEGISLYNLAERRRVWTGRLATEIAVSADGNSIAATYRDENMAEVYNIDGTVKVSVPFGDKRQHTPVNDAFANANDNLFKLNPDGSKLAVSFSDGGLTVFDLADSQNSLELYETSDYSHFEGNFNNQYFAFSASSTDSSAFNVIDVEEQVQTGGFESERRFGVIADERGIYVSSDNLIVRIDPVTGEQQEIAYADADIEAFSTDTEFTLVLTTDNTYSIFGQNAKLIDKYDGDLTHYDFVELAGPFAVIGSRDTPTLRILKLENHSDAEVFQYGDPDYAHDEARISADGSKLMLFSYNNFRIYDNKGGLVCEVAIPNSDHVYDQQYRRDESGSRLEVIYNDGLIRTYSGDNGEVISEVQGDKPDLSLLEQFYTDKLRIESPLHGAPIAYDRESGKVIRELETNAYLTYVTQVGANVITEYISANGERYGLLLDENCETLAVLPNLSDIIGNELIFDYHSGSLRKTRIYSIKDLLALSKI